MSESFHSGGLRIAFELRGEGPSLLMICGFRRSRVIWGDAFLAPLAKRFRLVLFDNRGTGDSDKPATGYSIAAFADDASALLRHLGIPRAHVFGVSMGGMIAQTLASRHSSQLWGLALGCTHAGGTSVVPPENEIWQLLRLLPSAELNATEVAHRQEAAYYTDAFRICGRKVIDAIQAQVQRKPAPPHAVQGHLAAIKAFDGHERLSDLRMPTLVLTGEADRLIMPENSRRIAQRISHARLAVIPDAAHFFWIEKPAESAALLGEYFSSLEDPSTSKGAT